MAEARGPFRGRSRRSARRWALGLLPLALLAALVATFLEVDPTAPLRSAFPPVEQLTIERITFPAPGRMEVYVVNGGPSAVTISQVAVDDAFWPHRVAGSSTVGRLRRVTVALDYPWVEGEPHEVTLLTATGLTFSGTAEVATVTPRPDARYLGTFALLGLYAGVVPVLLGLLWYPFLRDVPPRWLHFFLSLTLGLLVFLLVDALAEAFEVIGRIPGAFHGAGLIALGSGGSLVALRALGARRGVRSPSGTSRGARHLELAYLIAIGIGLHNLGEGLAIGAAYSVGEIALGGFLVIGFALHNTTEGLAIIAPVAADRPRLRHLATMGTIAGLPTIAGTWIGGFTYSPILAALFLAIGAGAILEVVLLVGRLLRREPSGGLFAPLNAAGLAAGLLLMYGTALLVVA
ncbi:MAG: ZIP family metal transporter [Gemmatimonadota bacterium]